MIFWKIYKFNSLKILNQLTDNVTIIFSKSQFVPPFSLQIYSYILCKKKLN